MPRGSANGTVLQHRPQRLLVLQLVLQLKKPNILQLYPVAIVSGCTVSGCSFCLFGVATGLVLQPTVCRTPVSVFLQLTIYTYATHFIRLRSSSFTNLLE